MQLHGVATKGQYIFLSPFFLFVRFPFYCLVNRAFFPVSRFERHRSILFFIFSFSLFFSPSFYFFFSSFYAFVHMHVTSLAIGNKKVHVGKLITEIPFYFSPTIDSHPRIPPLPFPPFDDVTETNRENDHERETKRDDRRNDSGLEINV